MPVHKPRMHMLNVFTTVENITQSIISKWSVSPARLQTIMRLISKINLILVLKMFLVAITFPKGGSLLNPNLASPPKQFSTTYEDYPAASYANDSNVKNYSNSTLGCRQEYTVVLVFTIISVIYHCRSSDSQFIQREMLQQFEKMRVSS